MAKRLTKLQQLQNGGAAPKKVDSGDSVYTDFVVYLRRECHLAKNTIEAYSRDTIARLYPVEHVVQSILDEIGVDEQDGLDNF